MGTHKSLSNKKVYRKKRTLKYSEGTYGSRGREQERLTEQFGERVFGETHESEHIYGFAALNRSSGIPRKKSRTLENEAPAYMEVKRSHRSHPGTGSSKEIGPSGFSSDTYRDAQRSLLEEGHASAAGQLNSLGYAFVPGFRKSARSIAGNQAHNSFEVMVRKMETVHYMQGSQKKAVSLTFEDRLEILGSRYLAEKGERNYLLPEEVAQLKDALNTSHKTAGLK